MRLLLAVALAVSAVQSPATIISSASGSARVVALTFDAGADTGYASRILQFLERHHIKASFGMTGRWAEQNPQLVRRMARDGDQIINHTYDHRSFTGQSSRSAALTQKQRIWEIVHADAVIRRLTGKTTRPYFRPPFGDYDTATLTLLPHLGYRYMVMWTVDSLGWAHLTAPAIVQRCLTLLRPGAILLMHVGIQSQDAIALPSVVAALQHRGYHFVTVAQLRTGH